MLQSVGLEIAHQAERRDPDGAAGIGSHPQVAVAVLGDRVDRIVGEALRLANARDARAIDVAQPTDGPDTNVPIRSE